MGWCLLLVLAGFWFAVFIACEFMMLVWYAVCGFLLVGLFGISTSGWGLVWALVLR